MGKPNHWWDTGRFRCINDHVSTLLLKTNKGKVCMKCQEYVFLTCPEDEDGPLLITIHTEKSFPEQIRRQKGGSLIGLRGLVCLS